MTAAEEELELEKEESSELDTGKIKNFWNWLLMAWKDLLSR